MLLGNMKDGGIGLDQKLGSRALGKRADMMFMSVLKR